MGIGGARQPLSQRAAEQFVDAGWAPSAVCLPGVGLVSGTAAFDRAAPPPSEKGGRE
jgi:hypothetical protein